MIISLINWGCAELSCLTLTGATVMTRWTFSRESPFSNFRLWEMSISSEMEAGSEGTGQYFMYLRVNSMCRCRAISCTIR